MTHTSTASDEPDALKRKAFLFVLHSKDEQKRLDSIIHYTHSNIIPLEMDGSGTFQQVKNNMENKDPGSLFAKKEEVGIFSYLAH